jgi:hypothetical protein
MEGTLTEEVVKVDAMTIMTTTKLVTASSSPFTLKSIVRPGRPSPSASGFTRYDADRCGRWRCRIGENVAALNCEREEMGREIIKSVPLILPCLAKAELTIFSACHVDLEI